MSLDTETTGLSFHQDSILEIGAVKFDLDGNVIDKFEQRYAPQNGFIDPEATKINGISIEDVKGLLTYKDNCDTFKNFCDKTPLVGHNLIDFDLHFLHFNFVETPYVFDTFKLAYEYLDPKIRPSLRWCCKKCDIDIEGRYHSAFFDAKQTMGLFLFFYNMPEQLDMGFKDESVVAKVKKQIREEARECKLDNTLSLQVIGLDNKDPYIHNDNLFIPFDGPIEAHWWKDGAQVKAKIGEHFEEKTDKYGNTNQVTVEDFEAKNMYPGVKFMTLEEVKERYMK